VLKVIPAAVGAIQVAVLPRKANEGGVEGIDEFDFWGEVGLPDSPGLLQAFVRGVFSFQLLILPSPGIYVVRTEV